MKNTKAKQSDIFLSLYSYANDEITLLRTYYTNTSKNINQERLKVDSLYQPGKKIDSLIDSFVERRGDSFAINEEKYASAKDTIIVNDVKFQDIIESVSISEDGKSIRFKLTETHKHNNTFNPNEARYKCQEAQRMEAIFSRSIISDLMVAFESLLSKLFKNIILNNPFPYLEGETVPIANFFLNDAAKSIHEKIEGIVDKRMYDSLKTLTDIIAAEKIDIDKDILASFKEMYFRRNVIVHNDCKVNKQYLSSINSEYRKDKKTGDLLICDQVYLDNAFNTVYGLLFFIFYGLLQNYSNWDEYNQIIETVAFSHLRNKDYQIAKTIYKKLSTNNSIDFALKMMYRINYLNALKQLGEKDVVDGELKKLDVSIATDNYKIAKLCLQDDNVAILRMLQNTYPNSFTAKQIKEWPIFINFRESEEYKTFCSEHTDDFANEEFTSEKTNNAN